MSAIHFDPQTADHSHNPRHKQVLPSQPLPTERPAPDEPMMHAWSIGTTEAARALGLPPQGPHAPAQEFCPPEVYIG